MTRLTLSIYRFLHNHKAVMWTLLLSSTIALIALGLQVEYEEDISSLLPKTNNSNEKLAFANLRVKDKIFILFRANNPDETDATELADFTDEFVDTILEKDSASNRIDDVLYQIDESILMDAMAYIADNFPSYVEPDDYAFIDSLLSQESIDNQMQQNYDLLTSSAGIIMKDLVKIDPIGMKQILIDRLKDVKDGLGSNQIIYNNHLFTPDTTVALVYISPSFKAFDSKSGKLLVDMLENEIQDFQQIHPEVNICFHGAPVQSVNNSKQIKKDLSLTVTVSLIICCFIIGLCFKNKSTLLFLLIPVLWGAFFALAMMYLVRGTMSIMALGIGAIVLGVALSYCLHVITHYKYVSTPEHVIKDQAKPVFLGCLTTIGSFLGLMFTQSDLLKDFGLFASFALVGTTFFSLVFLPHFFNPERNRKSKKAFAVLERFNSHPFERHKWLIATMILISVICFYTQKWVTFDSNLANVSYTAPEVAASKDLLASKTQPGHITTYYAASSQDLDSALMLSREVCAKLEMMKDSGRVKGYSKASTLFMTEDEQNDNIEAWKEYWTPEKIDDVMNKVEKAGAKFGFKPSLFSQFRSLLEADDIEPQSLYEAGIIPDGLLANMVEYTDSIYMVFTPAQTTIENQKSVGEVIAAIKDCIVVDPMFYASNMVETINNDFQIALNISMGFVFIVLLLSFRNLTLSILAFIPMTLSWFIVLGIMGIFGLQFNLINIVISTFIFGIGVDYSIFVMDGLLSNTKKTDSDANLLVYHKTAIFFSAVVLIIFTSSLLIATHPAIRSIGLATIIGMSSAVLLAYTLQPFLFRQLVKLMNKRGWKAKWLK
ncbi:MAG: MMPL family transporter [Marinilabiliaceae bacterium]|nr:MMPL family transporter [Marinilabiliaceae bacterium]